MKYLESIALIRMLPCLAEPGKIIAIGKPSRTLEDVLPYMATLPSVIALNPERCILTFRRQSGYLTMQSNEVHFTQVKDLDEGLGLLSELVESIDAVWEHRNELTAVKTFKHIPRPMDIWALLPENNYRKCDEQTSMAFAAALLQHKRTLAECLLLQSDMNFADRRSTLDAML